MTDRGATDPTIREGDPDDLLAVVRTLDGALLDVDLDTVRARLSTPGEVLVAEADGNVVGALVLDGDDVEALAVRRTWRGRRVGSALVDAAAARRGRLTAAFDRRVRPFYESCGFEIRSGTDPDGRLRGIRTDRDVDGG